MAQIIIDSSNNLIQGDFDNATVNNRTKFKTTTLNGTTNVYAVPNGSSTSAGYSVSNAADPTNASKITIATNGATDTQIISGINGTGSYLPLSFYTNNTLGMQLSTAGNLTVTGSISAASGLGGMTLLGTITITGGNSVSLGSLTLTSYKALFMSIINIDNGGVRSYISSSNVQSGGGIMIPSAMSGSPIYGTLWLDLASGSVGGTFTDPNVASNYTRFAFAGGYTNVSTSTTTIYFRNEGASGYGSGASIKIYGVA